MTDPGPDTGLASGTVAVLRELEESLWRSGTRFDPDHLERTFHPDFAEIGRSGRTWSRAESMAMEGGYEIDVVLPFPDLTVDVVAPGVALVTYLTVSADGSDMGRRSSLWLATDTGWRLRFHQGTPVP